MAVTCSILILLFYLIFKSRFIPKDILCADTVPILCVTPKISPDYNKD